METLQVTLALENDTVSVGFRRFQVISVRYLLGATMSFSSEERKKKMKRVKLEISVNSFKCSLDYFQRRKCYCREVFFEERVYTFINKNERTFARNVFYNRDVN